MKNQGAEAVAKFVEHDGVRVHVTVIGQGRPVVLLPSVGRSVEDFFELAGLLVERGCAVLLPTPRGIGGSTGPMQGITLHDFALDVAAVIRDHGDAPALVAGHAFGNWVARTVATDHPELVNGLAVLAAAHKEFPASLRTVIDSCMNEALPVEERLTYLRTAFFAAGHEPDQGWLHGWHPAAAKAQRAAAAATPKAEWWHAGTGPVLDVQSDDDPFAPASGRHLLQDELLDSSGNTRVTTVLIEDAGHALIPEQPEAVAEALAAFLDEIDNKNSNLETTT